MDRIPTRRQLLIFYLKSRCFILRRLISNLGEGSKLKTIQVNRAAIGNNPISAAVSPLWTETNTVERFLQLGKVQNLRIALSAVDGVVVPANHTFSFWRQLGPPVRARGFVRGRELRQGCLIPSVGGGLCQLSNALYQCALDADFEIIERHEHSQTIPGSAAEAGRDATVFWNYVDLRFRSAKDFLITTRMTSDTLIVQFWLIKINAAH